MEATLAGRTALVTGGNTGIGRAISRALARAGADVALTYYSHPAEGNEAADEILSFGRRALSLQLDATDSAAVDKLVAQAAEGFGGRLDILVNNAGHLIARVPIAEMTDAHWQRVIDVNLSSAFYCTRAGLRHMNAGWGRIVNVSSLAAHNGGGNGAVAYATAKAGLIAMTRGLAKEVAPRGITVNAVAPGLILGTAFHETFNTPEGIRKAIANIPVGHGGTPDNVAWAVLYFCSESACFVTGEVAEVNGGSWFA